MATIRWEVRDVYTLRMLCSRVIMGHMQQPTAPSGMWHCICHHTMWLMSTLQCWGLIFSNFTAQAHAANIWVNPKAPDADGLVVDRHFLQAHWYLMLVW